MRWRSARDEPNWECYFWAHLYMYTIRYFDMRLQLLVILLSELWISETTNTIQHLIHL